MTAPYMPLFIAEYLADTAHLSAAEHGAYLLLIMNYWQRGKPLPADDRKLARIARLSDAEWQDARDTLAEFFTEESGEWRHGRIERELTVASEKSAKAKASARASVEARKANAERSFNGRSAGVELLGEDRKDKEDKPSSLRSEGARKRAAPACLMPDDFEPSREDAFCAGMTEAETDREIAKFRDWAASAPADKARKRDWPATWRNWCRRVVETRPAHRTTGPPRPAVPKAHEQAARLQLILNEAESVTADRERQADRAPVALLAQR